MPLARTPTKPCMARVVVRNDLDPDAAPVHDKTGDHNERFFRDWITNTMYWAVRNNHSISIYPEA